MARAFWPVAIGLLVGMLAAAFVTGRGPFRRARPAEAPARAAAPQAAAPASPAPAAVEAPAEPVSPDQARTQELLRANATLEPDPELAAQYREINARYFDGALPPVPVRWEPRLADVGPLIAEGFRLEGVTDGDLILLNPAIRSDEAVLRRALCHEMVHVAVRNHRDGHGPVFQTFLRQLADQGAFTGLVATDEEKQALRASLDARAVALTEDVAALGRERAGIEAADAVVRADRAAAYNARVEQHNAAIAGFNRDVERYNLMIVYPDGLDRQRYEGRPAFADPRR